MTQILRIIAEDRNAILYRPKFTELTDSALAAILLQQMIYHWDSKDGQAFYKFKEPCQHKLYRDGDSWCERLGWNAYEFDLAIKVIGTKITKGTSRKDVLKTEIPQKGEGETDKAYYGRFAAALRCCVLYWTDRDRVTWYEVNSELLCKFVIRVYIDNLGGLRQIKKSNLGFTYKNAWFERRKNSEKTAENTTENTSKEKYFPPSAGAVNQSSEIPADDPQQDISSEPMLSDSTPPDTAGQGDEPEITEGLIQQDTPPSDFVSAVETFVEQELDMTGLQEEAPVRIAFKAPEIRKPTRQEYYDLAVCFSHGIKYPPDSKQWGYIRKLANFYTGCIKPPADGQKGDQYYQHQLKGDDSMTPAEIAGFALWWNEEYPDAGELQKAATIAEKVMPFRLSGKYTDYVERGALCIADMVRAHFTIDPAPTEPIDLPFEAAPYVEPGAAQEAAVIASIQAMWAAKKESKR